MRGARAAPRARGPEGLMPVQGGRGGPLWTWLLQEPGDTGKTEVMEPRGRGQGQGPGWAQEGHDWEVRRVT